MSERKDCGRCHLACDPGCDGHAIAEREARAAYWRWADKRADIALAREAWARLGERR